MRATFLKGYKRSYYITELQSRGINAVKNKSLHELTDRELARTLALLKMKEQ